MRPVPQAAATLAAAAAALGAGLVLSECPMAICNTAAPLLSAVQIADISAMILESYQIPMVPASLQAIIIGESVKAVAVKLEQEENIASSKFNQHFQTALEEGLTDALMDELVRFHIQMKILQ